LKSYNTILAIGGSDSGGGAGVQADIKTITSLNCYATSAITALTAQNTSGVKRIYSIDPSFIKDQIETILEDFDIKTIKIGMLQNSKIISVVHEILKKNSNIPIILDPVMISTNGDLLLESEAIEFLENLLFPLCFLLTPNLEEAQILSKRKITTLDEIKNACLEICKKGVKNILFKGGDLTCHNFKQSCLDVLCSLQDPFSHHIFSLYNSQRIETKNLHGTGCSLSSAIASFLSQGFSLEESIQNAKNYIQEAIESGKHYLIGKGKGPINHMWKTLR